MVGRLILIRYDASLLYQVSAQGAQTEWTLISVIGWSLNVGVVKWKIKVC